MKTNKIIFLSAIASLLILSSPGVHARATAVPQSGTDVCPLPTDKPEEILIDTKNEAAITRKKNRPEGVSFWFFKKKPCSS